MEFTPTSTFEDLITQYNTFVANMITETISEIFDVSEAPKPTGSEGCEVVTHYTGKFGDEQWRLTVYVERDHAVPETDVTLEYARSGSKPSSFQSGYVDGLSVADIAHQTSSTVRDLVKADL